MPVSDQYLGLAAGYATAILLVWLVRLAVKPAFLANPPPVFPRPWLEFGLAIVAVALIIGVGQLYGADLLLPHTSQFNEMANQVLIFSPMLALVVWRGQTLRSTFLTPNAAPGGLALGIALAFAALFAYAAARGVTNTYGGLVASVFSPHLAHNGVQVFLEDLAVAALLSRLALAIGNGGAVIAVAALFAAAHAPAMIANGATAAEFTSLVCDAALGTAVLGTVLATRSIWWFFPVHFVMDMTQFVRPQ